MKATELRSIPFDLRDQIRTRLPVFKPRYSHADASDKKHSLLIFKAPPCPEIAFARDNAAGTKAARHCRSLSFFHISPSPFVFALFLPILSNLPSLPELARAIARPGSLFKFKFAPTPDNYRPYVSFHCFLPFYASVSRENLFMTYAFLLENEGWTVRVTVRLANIPSSIAKRLGA